MIIGSFLDVYDVMKEILYSITFILVTILNVSFQEILTDNASINYRPIMRWIVYFPALKP